jgi:hypothetical protein
MGRWWPLMLIPARLEGPRSSRHGHMRHRACVTSGCPLLFDPTTLLCRRPCATSAGTSLDSWRWRACPSPTAPPLGVGPAQLASGAVPAPPGRQQAPHGPAAPGPVPVGPGPRPGEHLPPRVPARPPCPRGEVVGGGVLWVGCVYTTGCVRNALGPAFLWACGPMGLWGCGAVCLCSYGAVGLWACGPVGF